VPAFRAAQVFAAGVRPVGVVTADVDEDGRDDLAVLASGDALRDLPGGITIMRNAGGGGLEAHPPIAVGRTPLKMVAGDWNGDGHVDLATADYDSASVSVLIGDGRGGFTVTAYAAGVRPLAMVAADLDGDHRVDLVVANAILSDERNLVWLRNAGGGGFAEAIELDGGWTPFELAAGDLDGDGRPDLVTAGGVGNQQLTVLLNKGSGTFERMEPIMTGVDARQLQLGDVNGDDLADLVFASAAGVGVTVLFGDGRGGFFGIPEGYPAETSPVAITLVDMSGDGKLDVLLAGGDRGSVATMLNYGNGFFAPATVHAAGARISGVAAADLDGDGIVDLAVADSGRDQPGATGGLKLLRGLGGGRLDAPRIYGSPSAAVVGDVSGDGLPDLVSFNIDGVMSVFQGTGDGGFGSPSDAVPGFEAHQLAVADVDADGRLDVIVSSFGGGLAAALNDGSGGFVLGRPVLEGQFSDGMCVGDLDGDDLADVVVSGGASELMVVHSDGKGGFAPGAFYGVENPARAMALGDVNRDGAADLIYADGVESVVAFRLGDGGGAFASPRRVAVSGPVLGVGVADMDGDGWSDIVAVIPSDVDRKVAENISVLVNDGRAGFRPPVTHATDGATGALALGDFDGDGRPDVVFARYDRGDVGMMFNDGRGRLGTPIPLLTGGAPFVLMPSDLDGNGALDLAVANELGVAVLLSGGKR
jgi:hypothetical protein